MEKCYQEQLPLAFLFGGRAGTGNGGTGGGESSVVVSPLGKSPWILVSDEAL